MDVRVSAGGLASRRSRYMARKRNTYIRRKKCILCTAYACYSRFTFSCLSLSFPILKSSLLQPRRPYSLARRERVRGVDSTWSPEAGGEGRKTDKSTFSTVSNKRSLPPLRARLFAVATGHSCCLCLTADEGKKPLPNTQLCNLVIRLSALTPVLYLPFPLHRQNMLRIENWRMLFR